MFDCTLDELILGRDRSRIESLIPESIIEILSSDDSREIEKLIRYLSFYAELRIRS